MKSYVADFTPERLQNASAGRRYGQRKREAQIRRVQQLERAMKSLSMELMWYRLEKP